MKEKLVDKLNKLRDKAKGLIKKVNIFKGLITKIDGGVIIKISSNVSITLFYRTLSLDICKWYINLSEAQEDKVDILRIGIGSCSDGSAKWLSIVILGFGFEITKEYEIIKPKKRIVKKIISKRTTSKRKKRKTGTKK